MITVEQLLKGLADLVVQGKLVSSWCLKFVTDVHQQVASGRALSTAQASTVLKVAVAERAQLAAALKVPEQTVAAAIANPTYLRPPYQSVNIKREVRYVGANKLAFRFKSDPNVVADVKALKSAVDTVVSNPVWNPLYRLWIVTVTPGNLEKVFNFIQRHEFHFDDAVLEYLMLCNNCKEWSSTFILDAESGLGVANICNNPLLAYVVANVLRGELV